MSDETYNGWVNRETWSANLWLSNDEGLYHWTLERVADAVPADDGKPEADSADYPSFIDVADAGQVAHWRGIKAGEAVRQLWDEITDPSEGLTAAKNIIAMVSDVGSVWRVDWDEIGPHWLPENQ